MKTTGTVTGIVSNLVTVKVDGPVAENEICYIDLAGVKMMAEVIKVNGDLAQVQVFESTRGLKGGDKVEFEGRMLEVTLGPGLLSGVYDGLQNDLTTMSDVFLKRGEYTDPLDREKLWDFTPLAKPGDKVVAADWLGEVKEGWLPHKIMVPFSFKGEYTVKEVKAAGQYNVDTVIATLTGAEGEDVPVTMTQKWPVKVAIKGYREKPRPNRIMETGVRVIDTLNPIAEGGTGFIPGPFGCGKTVLQHAIAKQGEADVIVMAACGERANEVVEIFTEFPEL
ncbi:MAG: V-type ATP synthase subunit A, partial [Bacteroidales bacterium]|nr:V-type ATP synthase subunit A [Bacteroidales bacterium]